MTRSLLIAALTLGFAAPAVARQHQGHEPPKAAPQQPTTPAQQHQHEEQPAQPAQQRRDEPPSAGQPQHQSHDAGAAVDPPEAGAELPPDAPADYAADAVFSRADMDRARGILRDEHGGAQTYKIMVNVLEYQSQNGEDGYRWDGEAWFGGDINRFVIKTEGEGGDDLEDAEVQALYSRALDHVTDFQIGVRHDIEPDPTRTYLAVGFESLMPYWFEAEGALFVGERGQVLARFEGSYDFQLTQRLVLQPSAEFNLAAKDDAAVGVGSGLSDAEVSLRLRYEIQREFAPYVGISWERKFGETADYARADSERAETTSFVVGLRAWY